MNIDTNTLRFGVKSDLVIVGTNPEMADMTNPRGDLEGLAHYIIGEAPDGRRFIHEAVAYTRNGYAMNDMTVARLERLVDHLNDAHPSLDADHWSEIEPSYGSVAYQRSGAEGRSLASELDDACIAGEIDYDQARAIYHGAHLS